MSDRTHIEWTDATWSPVTGCTKVSPGCEHCYIERTPPFRMNGRKFRRPGAHVPECRVVTASDWHRMQEVIECTCPSSISIGATTGVVLHPDRFGKPLSWRKPRKVFVCSMADLFHDHVPDEYIAQVFAVMALSSRHTFQVLTKRSARLRSLLASDRFVDEVGRTATEMWAGPGWHHATDTQWPGWPLPNVWVGVSAEDQHWADIRIPALLETPAAVRWVSAEPLLGPLDLDEWMWQDDPTACSDPEHCSPRVPSSALSWVVVGGESGPHARPMHPQWARDIRDQCAEAGVPYLFKQAGAVLAREWGGKGAGTDPAAWPEAFPREYPAVSS